MSEEAINQDRCEQILECKRQIEIWTAKLSILEKEQDKRIKLARLRVDAENAWESLTKEEQRNKEFILAALESEELPNDFDDFTGNVFPSSIRKDRDVFLARVAREDFETRYRDDRVFVPPALRGDKDVILKIIPKHVAVVESMASSLRCDRDIFLACLSTPNLPDQMLQHFHARIRSDPLLMLKLCAHPDGIHSMNFVCQSLRNDKNFMLEAISCLPQRLPAKSSSTASIDSIMDSQHILRHASQRLKDDYDVVCASVQKCGSNLKYASYDLRRNRSIVVAATKQNAAAFRYCLPGKIKEELANDLDFVREHLAHQAPNELLRFSKQYFDSVCNDRDELLALLGKGLDWVYVPEYWQHDLDFVAEAVQRNPKVFLEISVCFQENCNIARRVIEVEEVGDDVILEATEKCPSLLSDRDAMLVIAKSWWTDVLLETLRYSPIEIRGDKEVMLEAVKNDTRMYEFVNDALSVDRDIVMEVMTASPSLLHLVDNDFQRNHPDVVVTAIKNSKENELEDVWDAIVLELWSNIDVAHAWISRGGEWHDTIDASFRNNESLILARARADWENFWETASDTMKADKEFMRKAITIDERLLDDALNDLRYDYDLTLLAFSQSHLPVGYYFNDDGNFKCIVGILELEAGYVRDFEFLVSFTKTVRERIVEYETFRIVVVTCVSGINHDSRLSVLNQGLETSEEICDKISKYVGVPEQEELEMLQRASANLLKWGL